MSEAAPAPENSSRPPDGSGSARPAAPQPGLAAPPRRPIYKRPVLMALLILILAGIATSGVLYYVNSLHWESTDDAFITGAVVQISPQVAGRVAAVNVTDNQLVQQGDPLVQLDDRDFVASLNEEKGALAAAAGRVQAAEANLAEIQVTAPAGERAAQAGIEQAQAGLETAQAAVGSAGSQVTQAEAKVAAATAVVDEAEAELTAARAEQVRTETDLQRRQSLASSGAVGAQEVTDAQAAARAATAQVEAARKKITAAKAMVDEAQAAKLSAGQLLQQARAGVDAARAQVKTAQEKLAQAQVAPQRIASVTGDLHTAQADVQRLKAMVAQAELNVSYTRLAAPVTGRVTKKSVEVGDYVQTGQVLLALVPQDLWVTANFKETQLARIHPGAAARITIDAYPGVTFRGHVDSIQRGSGAAFSLLPPENATGNYVKVVQRVPVKIVFDKPVPPQYPIGPGMSVVPEVKIP